MGANVEEPTLRYVDPQDVAIEGMRCEGMTIRGAAGNVLGTLQGFLIDPVAAQLRYLIVRTSDILDQPTSLLPFQTAQVDVAHGAIDVPLDEADLRNKRDYFPPWDDLPAHV